MATLLDLSRRIDAVAGRFRSNAPAPVNEAALAMLRYLLDVTPVDTSKALSNWQTSLGRPFRFELPPYVPGERGTTREASAEQAMNTAVYLLSTRRPGQTVYLSNNAPYIRKLNDGSSKQAPAGFVERAVIVGKQKASTVRLLSREETASIPRKVFRGAPVG